jgi:hypothetical protein
MTESLRALLAGAIDYAGMFPPAALSLEQALAKYREHRSGPEAWIVGRFVCPIAKLVVLTALDSIDRDGRVSVTCPDAGAAGMFPAAVSEALSAVRDFPTPGLIDTLELRWPGELVRSADSGLLDTVMEISAHGAAKTGVSPLTMFFELPTCDAVSLEPDWLQLVATGVRTIASYNQFASEHYSSAGFKLRCGGAGAIPSSGAVAAVICSCRDRGVFWKATAGLHHPFRHVDPELGVPVHGFLNLLTAAVMADVCHLDTERTQAILNDDDPAHFQFTDRALTWCELSATVPQIAGVRERALRSFGSCSIEEPWQDLTVLGLI